MNTNFKVIGSTRLGIKPKSTAPEADALTTRPSELLSYIFIFQRTLLPLGHLMCYAIYLSYTVFTRFVAQALIFLTLLTAGPLFKRAFMKARALVIFKVKLCTKNIVEDKYFTTVIFLHMIYSRQT